jgi:hypothetical protein
LPVVTSVTVMLVASLTTWLLVSTRPLDEMTMPVPSATSPAYCSVESTSTTPGSTLAAMAVAFSDPVPEFVPPLLPLLPLLPEPLPNGLVPKGLPPPNGLLPELPPELPPPFPVPPPGRLPEADVLAAEWLSPTAAPAPAPAASTATAA